MIGAFRTRISVERATDADDGGGGVIRSWSVIGAAWARLQPQPGVRRTYDDIRVRVARLTLAVRAETDVRIGDRIRLRDGLYAVRDARDEDGRGRVVLLDLEKETAS